MVEEHHSSGESSKYVQGNALGPDWSTGIHLKGPLKVSFLQDIVQCMWDTESRTLVTTSYIFRIQLCVQSNIYTPNRI